MFCNFINSSWLVYLLFQAGNENVEKKNVIVEFYFIKYMTFSISISSQALSAEQQQEQ